MRCKCGSEANHQELTPNGPHYGKIVCASCGKHLAWLPRPFRPLDKSKVLNVVPGAPLPQLTGKSPAQVAFGERCREEMLRKFNDDFPIEIYEAMRTIADSTFWIANKNKTAQGIRWPEEWT